MGSSTIKISTVALVICFLFGNSGISRSEPHMALRGGYKCSKCHVNNTGGGMRTVFGVIYSQTVLPRSFYKRLESDAFFDGKAGDKITFGANFRVNNTTTFGVDRPPGAPKNDNTLDFSEGNVYVRFDLVDDFLSFYFDETILPSGARNREAFAMIRNLPLDSYVKAGRMLLPFGYRILDDNSFIRQRTGFNYDNQDIGVEAGVEPGPFSLSVALTNGTQGGSENNVDKQISTVGSVVFRKFRIGGSFSRNKQPGEPSDNVTTMYGGFVGLSSGRFTLMGEADIIQSRKENETAQDKEDRKRFGDQLVFYASLNTLIAKGINLLIAYDYYDPRIDFDEDERTRYTLGFEVFPFQFAQVSAYYRLLDSVPQKPKENENQLVFQFHVFF